MLHTPTAVGALLAGAMTSQCFSWVKADPSLMLWMTEATNFLIHGISPPAGVLFTPGGTAVNVAFVCGYLPTRDAVSLIAARIRQAA